MHAFLSINFALVKKHHMSRGHNYMASDQNDADHYTFAAMAGCLVTSDRAFRDTASQIRWKSFTVIGKKEFLESLKRM